MSASAVTYSKQIALAFVFILAQAVFAMHVVECVGETHMGETDHDAHFCEICHFAERDDDTLPPVQLSAVTAGTIAAPSNTYANDVVSARIVRSPDPRAPPSS